MIEEGEFMVGKFEIFIAWLNSSMYRLNSSIHG